MATDYIIDTYTRSVRVTFSGVVTAAEMYEGRRQMTSDPAFDSSFSQLVDARSAQGFELNGYTIKSFAQEHVFAAGTRRAIVMTRPHDIGLARMFQIYRQLAGAPEETQIFSDVDTARRWLGLPSEG